jgi:dihydroorotase
MSQTLLITNGRVIDPANKLDQKTDILVENGKIAKIGKNLAKNYPDAEVIDASNKVVSPGFVDIHVHLREPGREDKETIHTASRSAAKGGITSVVAMPNTTPVADDQTVLEYVLSKAKKESLVNIFVSGTITKGLNGKEIAEIWELKKTGAVVVTDDGFDVQNIDIYRKAMQYCKTHDMPMLSHTEDKDLACGGQMHEGAISSRLGLKGIPACAEDAATARIICLVEDTDHQVHFTHVSTKGSLDLIKLAQSKKLKVTADVTPHHFSLTDEIVEEQWTYAKVHPPLRSEDHRKAIIKALKDNTVTVIATDHAPHLWTEKERQFEDAPPGMVGFETLLPLIITNLVDKKYLTLSQALAKITINPSKVLNLGKGTLSKGAAADITIFDPKAEAVIDRTKFESKGQNSPFHGVKLTGVVTDTIVNGKVVLRNSEVIT